MPDYAVTFAKSARKELEKLPPPIADRLIVKIEAHAADCRPSGCQKLQGANALWRIWVGDYRVPDEIHDPARIVDVIAVGNRKEVYRG